MALFRKGEMIRVQPSEVEARRRKRAYRQAAGTKSREPVRIIRSAYRGRAHSDIATDPAIARRTIRDRLDADRERGPDGLQPRCRGGPGRDLR